MARPRGRATVSRPVEVVIFDAGLTLLHAAPTFLHVFAAGLRDAGADVDVDELSGWGDSFRAAWQAHGRSWDASDELSPHIGDLDVEERFWRGLYGRILGELGLGGDHPEMARCVHDAFLDPANWAPYPEVDDVLNGVSERGARVALLSNWGPSLREILAVHELEHRFETVVISGEVGVAKPDPRIFEITLEQLDVSAGSHIAYVGDDVVNDIEPSAALGLGHVLVDRRDLWPDHEGPRVQDLRALVDVLPIGGCV